MVFYFTGTGNSLYVAKCLEEIMAANNQNQQTIELKDNELGRDRKDRL